MPVIGECPYDDCREVAFRPDPPSGEVRWYKDECEGCGRVVWTRLSRVDPYALTEPDFLREWDVDEARNVLTPRNVEG